MYSICNSSPDQTVDQLYNRESPDHLHHYISIDNQLKMNSSVLLLVLVAVASPIAARSMPGPRPALFSAAGLYLLTQFSVRTAFLKHHFLVQGVDTPVLRSTHLESQLNDAISFSLDLLQQTRQLIADLGALRNHQHPQGPSSATVTGVFPSPASIQANIGTASIPIIPVRSPADDKPAVPAIKFVSGVDTTPTFASYEKQPMLLVKRGKM